MSTSFRTHGIGLALTLTLLLGGCGSSGSPAAPVAVNNAAANQTTATQSATASAHGKGGELTPPSVSAGFADMLPDSVVDEADGLTGASSRTASATALPSSAHVDETYLPPVRDQGNPGVCTAFALGYTEVTYVINKKAGNSGVKTNEGLQSSPFYMAAVAGKNEADSPCNGTFPYSYYNYLVRQGSQTLQQYPYNATLASSNNSGEMCTQMVNLGNNLPQALPGCRTPPSPTASFKRPRRAARHRSPRRPLRPPARP